MRLVTTDDEWFQLVAQVAKMPEVIVSLLAEHRPDSDGRCVACTQGGRGSPLVKFPCTLYALASAAQMLRERGAPRQKEPPAA